MDNLFSALFMGPCNVPARAVWQWPCWRSVDGRAKGKAGCWTRCDSVYNHWHTLPAAVWW